MINIHILNFTYLKGGLLGFLLIRVGYSLYIDHLSLTNNLKLLIHQCRVKKYGTIYSQSVVHTFNQTMFQYKICVSIANIFIAISVLVNRKFIHIPI